MNNNENRKHQMFVRTQQFLASRTADFVIGSLGQQLATQLAAVITELDGHAAAH